MKTIQKTVIILTVILLGGLGGLPGCGGGAPAVCDFVLSLVANGPSASQPDGTYWSCQDSTLTPFDLIFFEDGAGATGGIGAFTWQETGCGVVTLQTSVGQIIASNLMGSKSSKVVTGDLTASDLGVEGNFSCFLADFEAAGQPVSDAIPMAPPDDMPPPGDGTDDEILPDPAPIGSILFIFAQDGQFLGLVNDNRFDPDSICNGFGTYGSKFSSLSIWNEFGSYGSDLGIFSAFNDLSSTPPVLFDEIGALAYVTTNTILTPRVDSFYLLGLLQASGCDVER